MRHYSAAFPSPVAAFLFTFLQCLYSCYYVLYGKSEVWEQFARDNDPLYRVGHMAEYDSFMKALAVLKDFKEEK